MAHEADTYADREAVAPCRADDDDEPLGGDPPCWAHLFEDDDEPSPSD